MAKTLHRLTVKQIDAAAPGTALNDGGGLLYRATGKAQGKWVFKFTSADPAYIARQVAKGSNLRQREMGLGAYPAVSLATAREQATAARATVQRGGDPIEEGQRDAQEVQRQAEAAAQAAAQEAMTFGRYADDHFLPTVLPGFSNSAHVQQWKATFATHAASLRKKPLASITREDVLAVLAPIWTSKFETAKRSRERIERLFSHAIQNGHFKGDNPAAWRQFDATLPRAKTAPEHHPAIPHSQIADFVAALRPRQPGSGAALMLEWITLTACRTGEARFATWAEIDLDRKVWAIPAGRMKMRRAHVVPLTQRMLEILSQAQGYAAKVDASRAGPAPLPEDSLFVGPTGKPLSEMAAAMLMRRLPGFGGYVPHGLRATFKTWAATETEFPRELIEEQLAHQLGAVEGAYQRASAFERRRVMLEAWAAYCDGTRLAQNVVPLRSGATTGQA